MEDLLLQKPLFVFGTLLDPDVRHEVFACYPPVVKSARAYARGYIPRAFPGESYPRLFAQENAITEGMVLDGFSQLALDRLSFYEGELYKLRDITVETGPNECIHAIYHAAEDIEHEGSRVWSLADWRSGQKRGYLRRCREFMSYFGKLTPGEADELWESLQ